MADYRSWLQNLANTSGGGLPSQEANALLQVVGNDGGIDQGFANQTSNGGVYSGYTPGAGVNYDATRGQIKSFDEWYGPQGIARLNEVYGDKYRNLGSGGSVLGTSTSTGSGGTAPAPVADDISFLNDQESQLRGLLGRLDTNETQALQKNEDEYTTQTGDAGRDKERAYAGYAEQKVGENQKKLDAQNTNNRNAGIGYRSLSQIIGRAAGRGSSAFRDLLPDVVGKDLSSKQRDVSETTGRNMQGIDKARGEYDSSFEGVLADLLKQKKDNEANAKTAFADKRIGVNNQLADVAGQRAIAQGGGYAQVKAAQQPFQDTINQTQNTVEGFFNQYRTPYVRQQAVATAPELSGYTTDRASINAQAQGGDSNNPYSQLLRKKLQGQA